MGVVVEAVMEKDESEQVLTEQEQDLGPLATSCAIVPDTLLSFVDQTDRILAAIPYLQASWTGPVQCNALSAPPMQTEE